MPFTEHPTASRRAFPVRFVVLGIVLIGANLRAPITSLGPILPDIQNELGLGDTGAGLLNSLPLVIFALLSLVAPRLGRTYGLERTLACALAAIAVGTVIRSIDLPGVVWLGTVVLSVGIALGNVLLPGLVKRDMPASAAGVIGLYAAAMAASAGFAAGLAVPLSHLSFLGWRWAIGVWALLALVTLAVWLPIVAKARNGAPSSKAQGSGPITARSPWRQPMGWHVSLFFAFHSLVFYSLVDWFATYAQSEGISASTAGYYLLVYQVVAVATNLGCAPLIRRLPDQTLLGFACGLLLFVAALGLYVLPSDSMLWIVSAGLGAGLSMTTSLSLFGLRTRDHHSAAALSGMAQFVGYIGAAIGPVMFGVLHEVSGSWTPPFIMLVVAGACVTLFATLAGRDRHLG